MVTQVKQADGSIGVTSTRPDATKNSLNVAKLDVGQGPVARRPIPSPQGCPRPRSARLGATSR